MSSHIYLDHNATSPLLPEVADAMRETALRYGANPESQHDPGRQARRVLEDAREQIGNLLGARTGGTQPDQIIFTSGGTEANNQALLGLLGNGSPGQLVISAIEHPCVSEIAKQLHQQGWQIDYVGANQAGIVKVEKFKEFVSTETRAVSLMLANNETGVLQPVAELARFCGQVGIPVHTDASQAVGKIPVHFRELNVAALCCTAHKFQGPLGIGVMLLRHGVQVQPMLFGGHQQSGIRPGTESVALAVGMCTALECWHRESEERIQRISQMRDKFEHEILDGFPEAEVIGSCSPRLPNTSNISFVGMDRQALMMAFDQAGIACSTGSACASGSSELSPTHLSMGLEQGVIDGSIRFSLGASTTAPEMAEVACRILNVCKCLRQALNR